MRKIFIITVLILLCFSSLSSAEDKFFEIKAKKFSYNPNILRVNKNDTVKIRLISEDVHHGFYVDGYGIKTSAYPGQAGSLKFIADKGGRFSFRCSVTCGEFHPYMVGYLIVEPNERFNLFIVLTIILGIGSLLGAIFRRGSKIENGKR